MKKFLSLFFSILFIFSSISYTTFATTNQCKANKHKYEWVTTKKATYFKKGKKVYKCTVCDKVLKTETIPKKKLKVPKFTVTVDGEKVKLKCYKVKGATQFYVRVFTEKEKLFPIKAADYNYNDKKSRTVNINKYKYECSRLIIPGTYYVRVAAERYVNGKFAQSKWSKKVKFVIEQ